ncbi:hypothetical protein ABZ153_02915 [Streptomyces sp. NPDC006290]|uniref:hypothetical protein n=1 Tax=Streptomyces sp. NPDC006290 TaxID=3156745 RepID=UPI0033B2B7BB
MSRGEETAEPTTGGDPAVPGKPTDLNKPEPAGEAPEWEPPGDASSPVRPAETPAPERPGETPAPVRPGETPAPVRRGETPAPEPVGEAPAQVPRFAVVISGDGSAAIDGEPVPSADGVTIDAAILDTLHGYARDRGTTVTATVSDPSAGYVAFVEVAPDGSSTLVDQREQPSGTAAAQPASGPAPTPGVEEPPEPAEGAASAQGPGPAGDDDGLVTGSEDDSAEGFTGECTEEAAADETLDEDFDGTLDTDDRDNHDPDDDLDDDGLFDDDLDDDDDFDVEAYTLEQQRQRESAPLPPPPSPGGGSIAGGNGIAGAGSDGGARPGPQLVRRSGSRQSDDEYVGPGLLHRPLVVGPVALVVAALVIVPLVILGSGGSDDGGRQKQAARSSDETSRSPQAGKSGPISTSSASIPPPPSPSVSPSVNPEESKGAKGSKGSKGSKGAKNPRSGGGVTVTVTARPPQATVTAKPAQDTAATAVNRLARNDPSGRHICYRAYVSGQGWQKPVCDGTMAGTSGRNRPIKALNIAVSGSDGSAANAFIHDPKSSNGQGKWEPQWTAVIADGRNNYIGSTKKSAPAMSGFAINIGSGRICQTAKVHGFDWGGQDCADARPGFVFGGALENDRWLEAVKFTV